MSTISTIIKTAIYTSKCYSFKDKWLGFLLAGLTVMGHHRVKLRQWYLNQVNRFAFNQQVQLGICIGGKLRAFSMRFANEGDYLIGGELVKGVYEIPNFQPELIIDGGGNIGMFSILAKSYFPQAKLVVYEPDNNNFEQLKKNLALNQIEGEVNQLGLWSKDVTLYYHSNSSETGYVDENPPGEPISCTLPDVTANCWLKLDIEGAEYEVLPTLLNNSKYPRWISMEVHYFDTKGQALLSLLRQHGYQIKGGDDHEADCIVISAYRN